mmetsp:Transcript_20474/g.51732  ORF Transcript_20474/g.51732 Transcript_20474/m.51732 type:complete len:252 (-) Transcript_20474:288-1043(-)
MYSSPRSCSMVSSRARERRKTCLKDSSLRFGSAFASSTADPLFLLTTEEIFPKMPFFFEELPLEAVPAAPPPVSPPLATSVDTVDSPPSTSSSTKTSFELPADGAPPAVPGAVPPPRTSNSPDTSVGMISSPVSALMARTYIGPPSLRFIIPIQLRCSSAICVNVLAPLAFSSSCFVSSAAVSMRPSFCFAISLAFWEASFVFSNVFDAASLAREAASEVHAFALSNQPDIVPTLRSDDPMFFNVNFNRSI